MGWIPEHLRSTVWYLLEPKFRVRVPQMALRSIEDIKLFGTHTSGDKMVDKELAKNETECMLSIAAIEEIHFRGFHVGVIKYDDTKRIYEYISNHLIAWKNLLVNSHNVNPDPEFLDELIRLDTFAAAVYDKAKFVMGKDVVQSLLARGLRSKVRLPSTAALRATRKTTSNTDTPIAGGGRDYSTNVAREAPQPLLVQENESVEDNLPKRHSYQSLFEHQKRLGDNRWK